MTPGKQTVVWCCARTICCFLWGGGVLVWKAADGLQNLSCHTSAACADKLSKPVIGPMCELLRRLFPRIPFGFTLTPAECVLGVDLASAYSPRLPPFSQTSRSDPFFFPEACTAADLINRNMAGRGEERSCYTS